MAKKKAAKKGEGSVIDREAHGYETTTVEGKDGKKKRVTSNGDRLAQVMAGLDLDAVIKAAKDNGLVVKKYPNAGMTRMNIGNMLRALIRKGEKKVVIAGKTIASL